MLSHHRHTGRVLAHRHTSYPMLALVMLMLGLLLVGVSVSANAGTLTSSGAVNLSGIVPGPPPDQPPVIVSPSNNQHFSSVPIHVAGNCLAGLVVVVSRNGIEGGSVVCADDGTFQLQMDLFVGRNDLVARQYDFLNQSSPPSPTVITYYDRPTPPVTAGTIAKPTPTAPASLAPLVLRTNYRYSGVFPGSDFQTAITIEGGVAPYALNIDWGDGATDLVSRSVGGAFGQTHTYVAAGIYTVVIKASDAAGQNAYLQTVTYVVGPVKTPSPTTLGSRLLIAWPIYVLLVALLLGFWLGERYDSDRWQRRLATAGV